MDLADLVRWLQHISTSQDGLKSRGKSEKVMDFANSQPINPVDMGQPIFMIRSFRESKFDISISPVAFDKPMLVEVSMVPFPFQVLAIFPGFPHVSNV